MPTVSPVSGATAAASRCAGFSVQNIVLTVTALRFLSVAATTTSYVEAVDNGVRLLQLLWSAEYAPTSLLPDVVDTATDSSLPSLALTRTTESGRTPLA